MSEGDGPERGSGASGEAPDLVLRGADDEIRTRDPHLGKVMLYQLSHVRVTAHQGRANAASQDWRVSEL